jgi:hypothetical protein
MTMPDGVTAFRMNVMRTMNVACAAAVLACVMPQVWAQGAASEVKPLRSLERSTTIVLPKVQFQEARFEEAIEFLRIKARDYDPDKKGVNVIAKSNDASKAARITLRLVDIPESEALREVSALAGATIRFDEHVVVINSVRRGLRG